MSTQRSYVFLLARPPPAAAHHHPLLATAAAAARRIFQLINITAAVRLIGSLYILRTFWGADGVGRGHPWGGRGADWGSRVTVGGPTGGSWAGGGPEGSQGVKSCKILPR